MELAKTIPSKPIFTSVMLMPLEVHFLNSELFILREALVISGCLTPVPEQKSFIPPPEPVLSTTGVLKDVIPFGLSFGNRNYLKGINIIGLRRKKYDNKKIMELDQAYKKIFSSSNLHENLSKINGEYKGNDLVAEVISFISKDKKRPICTPNSE